MIKQEKQKVAKENGSIQAYFCKGSRRRQHRARTPATRFPPQDLQGGTRTALQPVLRRGQFRSH